jgi:hypothetical protein
VARGRPTPMLMPAPPRARPTSAVAGLAPARGVGPVRAWQGMLLQSLDPMPRRAGVARAPEPSLDGTLLSTDQLTQKRRLTSVPASSSDQILSNERTVTRWAYAAEIAPVYAEPRAGAGRVACLRWYTDAGFPEIYLLLSLEQDASGGGWVKIRIPRYPNGQVGWVQRKALGYFHLTRNLLVVDRHRLRMEFFTNGRLRWGAPVGVGQPNAPTPSGHFWVQERFKLFDPAAGQWPYAFGTTNHSTLSDWPGGCVIGIHGPGADASEIPGHVSHGCIRVQVGDNAWLSKHLRLGTPMWVL